MNTNILFVTGAGSSMPYNYPSGEKLLEEIILLLKNPTDEFGWGNDFSSGEVLYFGKSKEFISAFLEAIDLSEMKSIDAFCFSAVNKDYSDFSKLLVGIILGRIEKKLILDTDDWLRELFPNYFEKGERFKEYRNNEITFLTFNYDTVIENYIEKRKKYYSDKSNPEIIDFLKKIEVFHVYGSVNKESPKTFSRIEIENYSKDIRLIREADWEGDEGHPAFTLFKPLFEKATKIFFLGFGFDDDNLSYLGIHKEKPPFVYELLGKFVVSTEKGLDKTVALKIVLSVDALFKKGFDCEYSSDIIKKYLQNAS